MLTRSDFLAFARLLGKRTQGRFRSKLREWGPPVGLFLVGFVLGIGYGRFGVDLRRVDVSEGIGIAAFVEQVRSELMQSEILRRERGRPGMFKVESVDLEVSLVASASGESKTGLQLQVVGVDSTLEYSAEKTHRMTLHLGISDPVVGSIRPTEDLQ